MDSSNRPVDDAVPRTPHVAPAPPPILTETTQWSFEAVERLGNRAGLLPPGGHSPVLWRDPLSGLPSLPAGGYAGVDLSMGSHVYASQHALVWRPGALAFDAEDFSPVDVLAPFAHLLHYDDISNQALQEANHFLRLQPHPRVARETAGFVREDPATLTGVVDRVVSGAGGWSEPAVRRAALGEASSKHWQRLLEGRDEPPTVKTARVANTLRAVLGFVFELMRGEFGHHLFRKLVSACSRGHLQVLVGALVPQREELVAAAKNRHGVRCIRKLLLTLRAWREMQAQLMTALSSGVAALMTDRLGVDLLQTCLNRLDAEQTAFIYRGALENLKEVARDQYGCLALTRCIDQAPASIKGNIVNRIISNSACLSQDPYGNYAVQHIIKLQDEEYTDRLCRELKHHCLQLSTQKHGSHVVERCIASAGGRHLLEALATCKKPEQVARDPYGNFVMQRALEVLKVKGKRAWYERLAKSLMAQAQSLKLHPNGRHVFKLLEENSQRPCNDH